VTWLTSALLYVPQPLAAPAQVPVLVTVTVLPRASASQEVATNNKLQLGEVEHRAWSMASSLEATFVGQCVLGYSPSSLRLVEHLLRAPIKVNPLIQGQSSISSPLSFSTSEYPQHQAPAYSNLNFKFQGSAHVRRPRAEGHSDCDRCTVTVPEAAFMRRRRAPRRGMEARDLVAAAGRQWTAPSSSGSLQCPWALSTSTSTSRGMAQPPRGCVCACACQCARVS
jgi:hypothetical protein